MKTVILSLLLLASSAYEGNSTYVYICTGPKAEVYHSTPKCSGLNRCSDEVVKVSLSKAKKMGRRACKKCY